MTIDKAIELLRPYVGRAAIAAAILAFGLAAAWLVRRLARREMTRHKSDPIAAHVVSQLAYAIVAILATAAALGQLGVQTASIVAVVGAAGIAVGLALQNSLSNLASGILLVTLKPFHAGDYIEGAGQAGSVIEVGFFTTTLRTFDGRKVVIPNSKLTDDSIVNYSTHPTRRIDAKVSVGYATDLPKARAVARDVLANDGRVLADPAPVVSVDELADSGITLGVRAWVKREDYWPVRFELLEKIKIAFDAAGIEIPFPQRVVRLLQDDTRNRGFSLVELTVVLFIL
ncbi:MAG: mechanosensitive ion channel, partial [Kiritimatiellae bacterium]|nr:mechanosensitive ion channel [Kiritimatiellia bacterium]